MEHYSMDGELWSNIHGFEKYEISTYGNVRKILKSKKTKPVVPKMRSGHPHVYLSLNGKVHTRGVMKLVASAFKGDEIAAKEKEYYTNNGCQADDGNVENCRLDNIYIDWVDSNLKYFGAPKSHKDWVMNTKYVSLCRRTNQQNSNMYTDDITFYYRFQSGLIDGEKIPDYQVKAYASKNGGWTHKDIRWLYDRWLSGDDMDDYQPPNLA